jgi:hypothetical protein
MKKEITTLVLTLATAFGFAQEALPETAVTNLVNLDIQPALPTFETKLVSSKSFGYLKMGVSDSELPGNTEQMIPGLGLGYRIGSDSSAFDLSAAFNGREIRDGAEKTRTYQYALKGNYLYYVTAARNSSLYAGGGLAWGGMKTLDGREFQGIIPNVALGYEMNRNAAWRSFVQLDVSQPILAASQRGDLPDAFAEISLGAGF